MRAGHTREPAITKLTASGAGRHFGNTSTSEPSIKYGRARNWLLENDMSALPARHNHAKAKLAAGENLTAFMVELPSVGLVQVLAASGVDVLIFDMEHGPIDMQSLHAMVAATRGTPVTPIVRIPWTEPWLVKTALETGAMGINFPMISTPELARRASESLRYPPNGSRGYAPSLAAARWGVSGPEYIRAADSELLNVITIEDAQSVEQLDEILAVPGIDVAAIASFDLSMSLGVPGQFDHPEVQALVRKAEEKVRRAGTPLGGVALDAQTAHKKRAAGYRMLLLAFDVMMIEQAARGIVQRAAAPADKG